MKKCGIYMRLQLKRMGKVFPAVFLVTLLLSFCFSFSAAISNKGFSLHE